MESVQTTKKVEWTEREKELAEKFGVEPKTVRLLTRIIEDKLTGLDDVVGNLIREVTGELRETVEEPEIDELAEKFGVEPKTVRLLKKVIEDVFAEQNYEADIERLVGLAQAIFKRLLKEQTGEEIESEQPTTEEPTTTRKYSYQEKIKDASDTERVIVDWLLKQNYSTRLACVIMEIWLNSDHNTDGIAGDILKRWSEEILSNVKNPPDNLSPEELAMSGVAVEGEVWRENL